MFTCLSCKTSFDRPTDQRDHFMTEWHRYNLKRRLLELLPLTKLEYDSKMVRPVSDRVSNNPDVSTPLVVQCLPCRKSFSSENALQNHLRSKRHSDRAVLIEDTQLPDCQKPRILPNNGTDWAAETTSCAPLVRSQMSTEVPAGGFVCLFCTDMTSELQHTVHHMTRQHGFFIPDRDRLCDLQGLFRYLERKIKSGHLCVFCGNGEKDGFATLPAVRSHMVDKGHCKMAYDTEEDWAEYMDFYGDLVDVGDDWEDVTPSDEDDLPNAPMVSADGLSLHLPNGRVLGHRSLKVYFQQNHNSQPNQIGRLRVKQTHVPSHPTSTILVRRAGQIRQPEMKMMQARNAGEAKWARRMHRTSKGQNRAQRADLSVGQRHNNQKHFRDPLLQ